MKFNEILKYLRTEKGLSQKKLAEILGYSQSIICDWENNISEPGKSAIIKLASFFKVSTDFILGLENEAGVKIPSEEIVTIPGDTGENKQIVKAAARTKGNTQGIHTVELTDEEFKFYEMLINKAKKKNQ